MRLHCMPRQPMSHAIHFVFPKPRLTGGDQLTATVPDAGADISWGTWFARHANDERAYEQAVPDLIALSAMPGRRLPCRSHRRRP